MFYKHIVRVNLSASEDFLVAEHVKDVGYFNIGNSAALSDLCG